MMHKRFTVFQSRDRLIPRDRNAYDTVAVLGHA